MNYLEQIKTKVNQLEEEILLTAKKIQLRIDVAGLQPDLDTSDCEALINYHEMLRKYIGIIDILPEELVTKGRLYYRAIERIEEWKKVELYYINKK